MKKYGVLAIIIIAIIIINLLTNSVVLLANSEEDTIEIYITGTQNYDYAYEMLELINKEREKIGLSTLKMDESLLTSSMERAAEIALYLSHTRPNGNQYTSINSKVSGENFTAGNETASEAMESFMASPTHKANILTETFSSVGIGHIVIEGINYWVQFFSPYTALEPVQKPTGTNEKTYHISLLKSNLDLKMKDANTTITLNIGEKSSKSIYNYNTWINALIENYNAKWTSSNRGVAVVDKNGNVTAVNSGSATITAKIENQTVSYNVYVPYEQLAKVEVFNTKAAINIANNTTNITSWDRESKDAVTTILDNKHNSNFIYTDSNYVYIQRLNENMGVRDTLKIQKRYPIYGDTIVDDDGNYYIAWGQNDTSPESTGKITFVISKYSNSGSYISSYEKTDSPKPVEKPPATGEKEEIRKEEPTKTIFANGTCNLDINSKGIIAYNYAKETKAGLQCNSSGYIDSNTMKEAKDYKVYPYAAHSWATDVIALSNGDFAFLQQTDMQKRSYDVSLITQNADKKYTEYNRQMFHFREGLAKQAGYYYTFSNYGSIEDLKTGVALIASSEKTLSLSPAGSTENESRNVFMQILKRDYLTGHVGEKLTADSFMTVGERKSTGTQKASNGDEKYFLAKGTTDYGVKWLTNYSGDYTVKNVKSVETNIDRIAIFYTVSKKGKPIAESDKVYYMVIDNEGDIVQEPLLLEQGMLPGYSKPVYYAGYVYFTNSNGTNNLKTYKIRMEDTQDKTLITVEDKEKIVNGRDKFNINATVNNNAVLEYRTTNSAIIDVTSDGTVTPKSEGEAEIIISAKNLPRVSEVRVKIIVDNEVRTISLDNTVLNLENGASGEYLEATVVPSGIVTDVIWTTSNESVATISNTANDNIVRIVPKNSGTCTITAYTREFPNIKATCNVKVTTRVKEIDIKDSRVTIESGDKYQLSWAVTPKDATNTNVVWSSSNTDVVTVDPKGVITGVNDGTAKIIARSQDNYVLADICDVIVDTDVKVNIKCTSIVTSKEKIEISGKNPTYIYAYAIPTNASNTKLNYSIKDNSIATIDQTGYIKPIKNGNTTIIIKTTDGTNITKEVPLTVTGIDDEGGNGEGGEEEIKDLPFVDVRNGDWFYTAVEYCYNKGIIMGATEKEFRPTKNITRVMIVTILWRMEGEPKVTGVSDFPDVKSGQYYYNAVRWATKNKIVNGYNNGKFGPNDNITREQLATILCNYAKYKGKNVNKTVETSKYADWYKVTGYARPAMSWAVATGVITGKYNGTKVDPQGTASRAEAAGMIYNYCTKIK